MQAVNYSQPPRTNVAPPSVPHSTEKYWLHLVVVYNNLLVTLVTQKIVVDRPL